MSSDLIAGLVGITLGVVVVVVGLRRDLADVTRSWLPRFGKHSESVIATSVSSEGGRESRQLSPRQRKFGIWLYLFISLCNAAMAVLSADSRLLHVLSAALFGIGALVFMLRRSRLS